MYKEVSIKQAKEYEVMSILKNITGTGVLNNCTVGYCKNQNPMYCILLLNTGVHVKSPFDVTKDLLLATSTEKSWTYTGFVLRFLTVPIQFTLSKI